MDKKTVGWIIVAAAFVLCPLAIHGLNAWYFPSPALMAWLAVPVIGPSLYGVYRLCRIAPPIIHARNSSVRRGFFCSMCAIMVPVACWAAVAWGIPAILMQVRGPTGRLTLTVLAKDFGSRACRYQLQLTGLSAPGRKRICVRETLFYSLSVGQHVSALVRRDALGTLVFDIYPGR